MAVNLKLKIMKILFCSLVILLVSGISFISCSNEIDEVQSNDLLLQTRSGDRRFVDDNLNSSQATTLLTKFLDRTDFFYFEDVVGFDPTAYIQYGEITVNYKGTSIKFRGISVGVSGKKGKYGVYASSPATSADIYSLNKEYPDLHGEVIYETNEETGMRAPVGVRYSYNTNASNGNNDCWIMVEWGSVSDFERIIGY